MLLFLYIVFPPPITPITPIASILSHIVSIYIVPVTRLGWSKLGASKNLAK